MSNKSEKKKEAPEKEVKTYKKGDTVEIPRGETKSINGIMYGAGKHKVRS